MLGTVIDEKQWEGQELISASQDRHTYLQGEDHPSRLNDTKHKDCLSKNILGCGIQEGKKRCSLQTIILRGFTNNF